ncbi:MAG: tetratricopeptide repeat protein [Dehalococcoidales bacterium]|nr:tetratricopeptide repeat protein [Dehalococcoidales bacterium]
MSSGHWDDYVEFVLPDGVSDEAPALAGLQGIPSQVGEGEFDLRVHAGPPTMLCILIDYSSAPERRDCPYAERIRPVLAALREAVPAFDFGDFLPQTGAAREEASSEDAPPVAEVVAEPVVAANAADVGATAAAERTGEDEHDEEGPGISHVYVAARFTRLAWEQARNGQLHKALRTLGTALRYVGDYNPALDLRQQIKVLEQREKTRRRQPRSGRAQMEVGFSYLLLRRDGEAEEALRQAVRLSPTLPLAHLLHGIALHGLGRTDSARRAYERAARLNPADGTANGLLDALAHGEPPPMLADDTPGATRGRAPARTSAGSGKRVPAPAVIPSGVGPAMQWAWQTVSSSEKGHGMPANMGERSLYIN